MKFLSKLISWAKRPRPLPWQKGIRVSVRMLDGTVCKGRFRGTTEGSICIVLDKDPTRIHVLDLRQVAINIHTVPSLLTRDPHELP